MTSLYSLRSTDAEGEFTIIKLSLDYEVESLYALNLGTCTCPAGHRPKCKHRVMLPMFLKYGHVNDGWLLDWDTRLWRKPIGDAEHQAEMAERSAVAGLADQAMMGNAEQMAKAIAPAFAMETSNAALIKAEIPKASFREIHSGEPPIETWPNEILNDIPMKPVADRREGPREPIRKPGEIKRRKI